MSRSIFGWDLPPGCRISDIPGNRPEDERWEATIEGFWNKKGRKAEEQKALDNASDIYVELIDQAIKYGMELGQREEQAIVEENKYYEQLAEEQQEMEAHNDTTVR